jgi:hypothetical protein
MFGVERNDASNPAALGSDWEWSDDTKATDRAGDGAEHPVRAEIEKGGLKPDPSVGFSVAGGSKRPAESLDRD